MTTLEQGPTAQPLPIEAVIPFVAATNFELKSLLLGTVLGEEQIREDEIYRRLIAAGADQHFNFERSQVKKPLQKLPHGLVEIETIYDRRGISAELTDAGEMAASLGGHFLRLSIESGRSTRVIAGERLASRSVFGVPATLDTTEGRLAILTSLYTQASEDFAPTTEILEQSMEFGLSKHAAYQQLAALKKKRITETRDMAGGKRGASRPQEIRLRQDLGEEDLIPPAESVKRFLTIVGRFAITDPEFHKEGLQHMFNIRDDAEWVPLLIERSFRESGHTGKKIVCSKDTK